MKGLLLPLLAFFGTLPALAELPLREEQPPAEIRAAALAPERVLDELPCDWRPVLEPIFRPVIRDCRSTREAVLTIASRLGELTGVYYDTGRRKPNMNALEALAEKKVSCTGQSILLVCALRSVGIPARAVGIGTWNHVQGNHTWVETWFDGGWHMVEANEKDFNTPWVMEAIGMLDPSRPQQRVFAVQEGGSFCFPAPWNLSAPVAAEDVTERYLALARKWYAQNGVPEDCQRLLVDVRPRFLLPRAIQLEDEAGVLLARSYLPTPRDDMRQFARILLPRNKNCYLRIEGTNQRYPLKANAAAVQTFYLRRGAP